MQPDAKHCTLRRMTIDLDDEKLGPSLRGPAGDCKAMCDNRGEMVWTPGDSRLQTHARSMIQMRDEQYSQYVGMLYCVDLKIWPLCSSTCRGQQRDDHEPETETFDNLIQSSTLFHQLVLP